MSEHEVRTALIGWEASLEVAYKNPGQWSEREIGRMQGYVDSLKMVLRGGS
jgi:hypothetical protein